MKLFSLLTIFICLLSFPILPSVAQDQVNKELTVLKVDKKTQKQEIRYSQIGFRDTLLFYTFKEQKAVLKLQIDNKDKSFSMKGMIFLFDKSVSEDGIKKWVNNQHSDALYGDAARPKSKHEIESKICKVVTHKLVDQSKQPFGVFDNYLVQFEIKDFTDMKHFQLKRFSGEAKVHVKVK